MNQEVTSWQDTQKLLAFIVVIGFFALTFLWLFYPPKGDAGAMAVLNILIGADAAMAGTVIGFYFGSSRSAANKDETIKQLSLTPPTPPTPPKV
jgi:hypothetical protein